MRSLRSDYEGLGWVSVPESAEIVSDRPTEPPTWGFTHRTPRSRYVECIVCGRSGAGWTTATLTPPVPLPQTGFYRWQRKCMVEHTWECACGIFFPSQQALAVHVVKNWQYHKPGHGRMDRVGNKKHG
jgi:hypothetical protein